MEKSPQSSTYPEENKAILDKIDAFSYVYFVSGEINYVSKSGEKIFDPLQQKNIIELFSSRKRGSEIEQQITLNEVKVFSAKVQLRDVTLYEKNILIKRNNEEIKGIQGICIFKDQTITLEEEMTYVCVIFKSSLSDCLASPIQLPNVNTEDITETVVRIFEEMLQYRKKEDLWLSVGRGKFSQDIKFFIERYLPIHFILPAFPFKCLNTEYKVLGKLPDKGEELAMQTLINFCQAIERVYPPGAKINIVSDGTIFSDIGSIPEENVLEYKEKLKQIIPGMDQYISFRDLGFFFDYCDELMVKREELLKFSGHSLKEMEDKVKTNIEALRMYLGFIRLFEHDHFPFTAIKEFADRTALKPSDISSQYMKKVAKGKAKIAMIRNDAYSRLIEEIFPLYVRFTIHLYDNSGPKFSIKLMNLAESDEEIGVADNHIPTPWHNVIVETQDGKYTAMRRYEAQKLMDESHLVYYEEGWPSHYRFKE